MSNLELVIERANGRGTVSKLYEITEKGFKDLTDNHYEEVILGANRSFMRNADYLDLTKLVNGTKFEPSQKYIRMSRQGNNIQIETPDTTLAYRMDGHAAATHEKLISRPANEPNIEKYRLNGYKASFNCTIKITP